MLSGRSVHLSRVLAVFSGTMAMVVLVVEGTLAVVTTQLHEQARLVSAALQSVRVLEEVELGLLLHDRETSPVSRASFANEIEQKLIEAHASVTTSDERVLLARADAAIHRYLDASSPSAPPMPPERLASLLAEAFRAATAVLNQNLSDARRAEERIAAWDDAANTIAFGSVIIVALILGTGALWLRRALRPIVELAQRMERFTAGEHDVRAQGRGPAEVALIASRFNEMADTLTRQREDQLAFIAAVAHDLRNPLSALMLSTATIQPDRPLPPEEKVRRLFAVATQQAERLRRMVEDLLDTAAIETGRVDLRLEERDLRGEVEDVADLYRSTSSGHEIVVALPDTPVTVSIDPTRVHQVLDNLVSNAIKYSPEGGQVRLAVEVEGGDAVVSVADEGVGIAPADQARIFEPFRRTRASRERFPGVGLGLSVARRIVAAHRGRIEVDSAPGKGSVFRVRVPLPVAGTAGKGADTRRERTASRGGR